MYVEADTFGTTNITKRVLMVSNETNTNTLGYSYFDATGTIWASENQSGSPKWSISSLQYQTNVNFKIATAISDGSNSLVVAGTVYSNTFVGHSTDFKKLIIGSNAAQTGAYLNGHIKRIAYYPSRLSNAELRALTT